MTTRSADIPSREEVAAMHWSELLALQKRLGIGSPLNFCLPYDGACAQRREEIEAHRERLLTQERWAALTAAERSTPPNGWDTPPVDLDAEGRTREATAASPAAAAVVRAWRAEHATWRWIALAAWHRWPHLRFPWWDECPSRQSVGQDICAAFGVVDEVETVNPSEAP